MDEDKAKSEADAKKDLIGLLKSKGLTPEEHKKILAIATSIGYGTGSSDAERLGSRMTKAVFILVTLMGIALMTLAWFLLGQLGKRVEQTGPRVGGAPAVAPDDSSRNGRGPGR